MKLINPTPEDPKIKQEKVDHYVELATTTTERLVGCVVVLIGAYMITDTARQITIHTVKAKMIYKGL